MTNEECLDLMVCENCVYAGFAGEQVLCHVRAGTPPPVSNDNWCGEGLWIVTGTEGGKQMTKQVPRMWMMPGDEEFDEAVFVELVPNRGR